MHDSISDNIYQLLLRESGIHMILEGVQTKSCAKRLAHELLLCAHWLLAVYYYYYDDYYYYYARPCGSRTVTARSRHHSALPEPRTTLNHQPRSLTCV